MVYAHAVLADQPSPDDWPFPLTPLSAYTGAEISGLDLARPLGDDLVAAISRALGLYGVVVFRDQNLTPEQHIALARQFGEIDINRFFGAAWLSL